MNQLTSAKGSQTGIGLLEAIISVALSAIVILGGVYSTSRIMVSQQQNNLHYIVINEMSRQLQAATVTQKESWCAGDTNPAITLPNATSTTAITVSCSPIEIEVTGDTSNPSSTKKFTEQSLVFTVNVPALGGDVTVGEAL